MKTSITRITFGVVAAALLATATAHAARPANVARTTWLMTTNRGVETLTIDTQSGPGAPGAATCRIIRGQFAGIADIRGSYCPNDGRIHFVHTNADTGVAVRVFNGYVSDDVPGETYMAGTFMVLAVAFGDYGEYPFFATQ
jgi:hypothetical protein